MDEKIALRQISKMNQLSKKMRLAGEGWKNEFQHLIAIMLSARTRDEMTIPVAESLFKKYPNSKSIYNASISDIEKIIRPINFYKNKSKFILSCAKKLEEQFNGEIPHNLDELITLPGVGRKTANVFLSEMGKIGIGVDTHVSYISQKLCWTKNTNPHNIEEDLKNLFSKKNWNKINPVLVRFGKTHTSRREKDKLLEEIKKIK